MQAPHLPSKNKSSRVSEGRPVSWIVSVLVIAVLASVTTTIVVVAWLAPLLASGDFTVRLPGQRNLAETPTLDENVLRSVTERFVTVYDGTQKIGGQFYPDSAVVGRAALLTLDGWAVMPFVNYKNGTANSWEAIDSRGFRYPVIASTYDPLARLVYIRLEGDSFPVMTLASIRDDSERVFGVTSLGVGFAHLRKESTSGAPQSVSVPFVVEKTDVAFGPRTPLVTEGGALVGFARTDGTVTPVWFVARQLDVVLGEGRVAYRGFPWDGYLVRSAVRETGENPVIGFYVSKSATRATANTVGAGDIVVAIDGRPIDPATLTETLLQNRATELTFDIIRNGKPITLTLPVVDLDVKG